MPNIKPGLGNAASYQVSGKPFATGSLDATTPVQIDFPSVTRWVQITNTDNAAVKVGFSLNGVNGTNYFDVPQGTTGPMELKVTQLFLSGGGADATSVAAGLTFISNAMIDNPSVSSGSATATYYNWSGSAGVG